MNKTFLIFLLLTQVVLPLMCAVGVLIGSFFDKRGA